MLGSLAHLVHARPRRMLAVTAILFAVGVAFGGPVADHLSTGNDFLDPDSESVVAGQRVESATGTESSPSVVVLLRPGAQVTSTTGRARLREVVTEIRREPLVRQVLSFQNTRDPSFVSRDGTATFVAAFLAPVADERREAAALAIDERLRGRPGVLVGGRELAGTAVGDVSSEDLAKAESVAFPLLFVISLWVFRGFVAALLPLFVGVLTIVGTFLALRIVTEATLLSIYALNLAIALGLGLSIDYSLFVVSRYREELERVGPGAEALRRTLTAAGTTVLFSALTVAAALAALLVFPQRFLYSMGIAGVLVALIAALASLTALPALIALLGPRVNAGAPRRWREASRREARQEGGGFWDRLSRWVMRRPVPVATLTAVALIALGLPFLGIRFTGIDASVLPERIPARQVDDALRRDFPASRSQPVTVVIEAPSAAAADVRRYAAGLERVEGVAAVATPRSLEASTWAVDVVTEAPPLEDRSLDVVREIRARDAPFPVAVAGQAAEFVDQQSSLAHRLPAALVLLAVTTLVLLFAMTGSVVLPLKSLLMNCLTLSAAFGLLVLIFQDGRFEGLLDYRSQGALEATQPIVLFALGFALSTDYGVFLLTRIKEYRDHGATDEEAVAAGLERTGRIVTAAALLLSIALGAFVLSDLVFVKQVGLGTVFAVLIDATIIRALLVPSLMALLGSVNWWAPRPLRSLYERFGLREST